MRNKAVACLVATFALGAFSMNAQIETANSYTPYPAADSGYITDIANLLSDQDESELEGWLFRLEAQTGVEVAVVTLNSIQDYPGTANRTIETFARGLFDAYGIGNMPENNGVLLLVARNDRKARIELGAGYGQTRNGDANSILQNKIIPAFKKERYDQGIREGVRSIMAEFGGTRVGWNWKLISIFMALPIAGTVAYSLFQNGKRGWGWVFVGVFIVLVLVLLRILISTVQALGQHSSGGGGLGAGGFGGGFGGGFSGGGGATGGW